MSVILHYDLSFKAVEDLAAGLDLATGSTFTHKFTGIAGVLNADSDNEVSKVWSDNRALAAGTDTIDLTSLARGSALVAEDFTGLYVKFIAVMAPYANTAAIKVTAGGANGYLLWGSAAGELNVGAEAVVTMFAAGGPGSPPVVAAGAKNITLTSTDLDATYDILLVAGPIT